MPTKPFIATSFRMSLDGRKKLQRIADQLGISKTAALEVIIRAYQDQIDEKEGKRLRS